MPATALGTMTLVNMSKAARSTHTVFMGDVLDADVDHPAMRSSQGEGISSYLLATQRAGWTFFGRCARKTTHSGHKNKKLLFVQTYSAGDRKKKVRFSFTNSMTASATVRGIGHRGGGTEECRQCKCHTTPPNNSNPVHTRHRARTRHQTRVIFACPGRSHHHHKTR
jgi:hypothetical protein